MCDSRGILSISQPFDGKIGVAIDLLARVGLHHALASAAAEENPQEWLPLTGNDRARLRALHAAR